MTLACGSCREDCPDRGQPHNMRTVTEEECAMTTEQRLRDPIRSILEQAEGEGLKVSLLTRDGDFACAAIT